MQESDLSLLHHRGAIDLLNYNLYKINLEDTEWINENLKNCNLTEACIKKVDLSGANLEEVKFNDVVLDGVKILRKDFHYIEDYIDASKVVFQK